MSHDCHQQICLQSCHEIVDVQMTSIIINWVNHVIKLKELEPLMNAPGVEIVLNLWFQDQK